MKYNEVIKVLEAIQSRFNKDIESVKLIVKGYCATSETIQQIKNDSLLEVSQ